MPAKLLYSDDQGLRSTDDLRAEGVIIGRAPESVIPTQDKSVAERHCRISLADGQWIIQDLESPTGTVVNGQRVGQAVLRGRDVIACGELKVQFADTNSNMKRGVKPGAEASSPDVDKELTRTKDELSKRKAELENALAECRALKLALERSELQAKEQFDRNDRLRTSIEEDNRKLRELAKSRDKELAEVKHLAELRNAENLATTRAPISLNFSSSTV